MKIKLKVLALLCICILAFAATALADLANGPAYVSQVKTYFRVGPSTQAGYYTQLDKGTRVTVTGSEGGFYRVNYNGQNGYIMKSCLSAARPADSATAKPGAAFTNRTGYLSMDKVYFRKAPSTGAEFHCQLSLGTAVDVTGEAGQFYAVSYNGLAGYVMKNCISFTRPSVTTQPGSIWNQPRVAHVTENWVYFRKGPSTASEYYTQLPKGTEVLAVGESGSFYKVTLGNQTGYIMKNCLTLTSESKDGAGNTEVNWNTSRTGYLCEDLVYFRKAPSTQAGYYMQLPKGTVITATGESGNFYKVSYAGYAGYIMKYCVAFSAVPTAAPVPTTVPAGGDVIWTTPRAGYITLDNTYFRTGPSTASASYGFLAKNTVLTVNGENGNFYKVAYGGRSGYVMKPYVTLTAPSVTTTPTGGDTIWTTPRTGYITLDNTYFRTGPSTASASYGFLARNTAVTAVGENGNFYKVNYGGRSGYVMKTFVAFTAPVVTATPSGGDIIWTTPRTGYITLDNTYFRTAPSTAAGSWGFLARNTAVTATGENGNFYKVTYGGHSGYVMKTFVNFTAPVVTTTPSGGDIIWTTPRTGYVTLDNTYFRTGPSTASAAYGFLAKNTAVTAVGENGNFYKVNYGGRSGYVMKAFINFSTPVVTTTPAGGDTIWPAPRTGYVTLDNTYFRTAPSTAAGSWGFLAKNTAVTATGENGNFYKVTYGGRSGYVMKEFINFTAPIVTATPSGGDTIWPTPRTGYITLDNTYFRTGPSTASASYGFLSKNTAVTAVGENGNFYKVTVTGHSGYVMKTFVTFTAPVITTTPSGGDTIWSNPRTGYITLDNTYFRTGPSTSSGSYGFLSKNTAVTVIGENGNFYKATVTGHSGYVMKTFVTFTAPVVTNTPSGGDTIWTNPKTGYVTLDNVYFRTGPSTSSGAYGFLAKNTAVTAVGENGNFYKVTYAGRSGYVMKDFITFTTPSVTSTPSGGDTIWSNPKTGYVTMNDVYFRTGPSTSAGSHMMLKKSAAVTVMGENGNFYKVTYGGKNGYVMKTYISFTKPASSEDGTWATPKTGYITLNGTNFRAQPSLYSAVLATLNKNAVISVTGENGDFYKATYNGTSGYVMRTYVTFSSSGGGSGSTGTAERLDWFNGGKNVFSRGDSFQMKDCYTGKVVNCYIQSAGNHLDAEPLTAADTATLLGVYGGSWSYVRRPVLVRYNGHVYAGSLYCEPHGEQVITDNNFPGQFCVHFYGSKTHGTSVVDADHQAAVATAMNYSW